MNAIQIYINKTLVDKPEDSDIGLRLQRFLEDDYELTQRGGDYSLTLDLPITKTNERIFGNKTQYFQYRKFGETTDFPARIELNGTVVFEGVYRLSSVTRKGYRGEFAGIEIDWLSTLDSIKLRELGYVDGEPTWLVPFRGMNDVNQYNEYFNHDIVFPDISYNNVPITDYLDYTYDNIYGTNPKDLPYDFPAFTAEWSWRYGSTFEDFPPAVKYEAVLRRIFAEIGYDVKGDVLKQEWFKRLILPYTGDRYIWNWQTLAKLELESQGSSLSITFPGVTPLRDSDKVVITDRWGTGNRYTTLYYLSNIMIDVPLSRVDAIANFKKWNVTSDSIGYVAPENGVYNISATANVSSSFQHDLSNASIVNGIGQGYPNIGWGDTVLIYVRENENGDMVLNPDTLKDLVNFMNNINTNFIDIPNDIIAYVFPKRVGNASSFPNSKWVYGSPVQNWEVEPTWSGYYHTESAVGPTTTTRTSSSQMGNFSINVQLRKNERVHAYMVSLWQLLDITQVPTSLLRNVTLNCNTTGTPGFNIDYTCSTEDIDVAINLPDISAKEFLTGFIRLFNLTYRVDIATKSITFLHNKFRDNSKVDVVDITDFVDEDSIEYRPVKQPAKLTIGYDNDTDDRLLTSLSYQCDEQKKDVIEYANAVIYNDSVYADGTKDFRLPFSATKFVNGAFGSLDITSTTISQYVPFNKPNGDSFYAGLQFSPDTRTNYTYQVPSIQTQESFDMKRVGDLTYSWNYKPRLLYYVGVPEPDSYFLVGTPFDVADNSNFWKKPALCTFDGENNRFYNGRTYPSLNYNSYMYNQWFNNQSQVWRDSHVFKADIQMNPRLWNKLDGSQRVVYNNDVYRLLTIEDYDVSGDNLASITLLKLT